METGISGEMRMETLCKSRGEQSDPYKTLTAGIIRAFGHHNEMQKIKMLTQE